MKIRAHTSAGTIDSEDRVLLNGHELRLIGETHSLPTFQHLDGSGKVSIFCEGFLRDAICDGRLILHRGFFNAEANSRERPARRSPVRPHLTGAPQ
ncbi:hypothetical protein CO659_25560 [Rhizobium sp. S9]|uniref:hypothetical protein n=1 Tax=unclassified Rhizobium TaxID=2613769 RepID=UPI000A210FA0|nr:MULTISPECIES: hypothetical protein [unclassified Rhizobium]ARO23696.1 hypothetical protein TAL182_CH01918 [Rhizobium sp. TAL182]PDS95098.1 hypothetical protein CO659_25560 [Rhizobium sp. S9]